MANNQSQPAQQYKFHESQIDWDSLEKLGVSKQFLVDKKIWDTLMKGWKTNRLIPIALNIPGLLTIRGDAKLSFMQERSGRVILKADGVRQEPTFNYPFLGHTFNGEDRKNLLEKGNMGRVVDLYYGNQYHPSFISLDPLTKELAHMRTADYTIPNEIGGVPLQKWEKEALAEGKAITLEGMIGKTSKKTFSSDVQVSAAARGIQYIFDKQDWSQQNEIGGVKLTPEQKQLLSKDRTIFLKDMYSQNNNEYFSSYVTPDPVSGKLNYTNYNPEVPGEIYIPDIINKVKLTPEEHEKLYKGEIIFLNGMINNQGQPYDAYVKVDLTSGRRLTASNPVDFEQKEQKFEIPPEVMGKKLTAGERGKLQDGKVVYLQGLIGQDGVKFNSYAKANPAYQRIDVTQYNPDLKAKQNVENRQKQEKAAKEDKPVEKKKQTPAKKPATRKKASQKVS